jgi:glycosyltransferase involved in cell wall biosynthesis
MKCGVGDYSGNLAQALATLPDTQVGVLTGAGAKTEGNGDIEVLSVARSWALSELPNIAHTIRRWSPHIVHVQYPTQGFGNRLLPWLLPLVAFLMGKKVIQTWHEGYPGKALPKLLLKMLVPGVIVVVRQRYSDNLHPVLRWLLKTKHFVFVRNAAAIPKCSLSPVEKEALRQRYLNGQRRLVVFFGFVLPNKRVEWLFDIANPECDQLVIAGEMGKDENLDRNIRRLASGAAWAGKTTLAGFLSPIDAAALLSVADAVVLPFLGGGGEWNTSTHSAILQGTFVLTTSATQHGYDERKNIYYARNDVVEMQTALNKYAGRKSKYATDNDSDDWHDIAREHHSIYLAALA